jgi:hypothetical protein
MNQSPQARKLTLRRLTQVARKLNPLRRARFYRRGWAEIGRMHGHYWAGNGQRVEQRIKRANWIHNLLEHGVAFRGELLR